VRYLGEQQAASMALLGYAQSPDPTVRERVAQGLAELGTREAQPALLALAADPALVVRLPAIQGLGRMKVRGAAPLFRKGLKDASSGVRRASAIALGQLEQASEGAALFEAAQTEGELEVRAAMLEAVGRTGDQRQVKTLMGLLGSSSESTRSAATHALCLLGAQGGLQRAQKLLASSQPDDRREGLSLLEGVKLRWSQPLLRPVLEGRDRPLAARAAVVLHRAGDGNMVRWLVKAEHTAPEGDRLVYLDALEQLDVTDEQRVAILRAEGWR
jgi:HEAT repeat protein